MSQETHPIVLRFASMFPHAISGYQMHMGRNGGDLGHCDPDKPQPRIIHGDAFWANRLLEEIAVWRAENHAAKLEYHKRRGDRAALKQALHEGAPEPWARNTKGPLREVILTANKKWFEDETSKNGKHPAMSKSEKEQLFEKHALAWLTKEFGDDFVHARADEDETTYHIHAVIMPRGQKQQFGTTCRMLLPSVHSILGYYERAQTSVGEWFSDIGLRRGTRYREEVQKAVENGQEKPKKPRHMPAHVWRELEKKRLAEKDKEQAEIDKRQAESAAQQKATGERQAETARQQAEAQMVLGQRAEQQDRRDESLDSREAVAKRVEDVNARQRADLQRQRADIQTGVEHLASEKAAFQEEKKVVANSKMSAAAVIAFVDAVAADEVTETGDVDPQWQRVTPQMRASAGYRRIQAAYLAMRARVRQKAQQDADVVAQKKMAREIADIGEAKALLGKIVGSIPDAMKQRIKPVFDDLTKVLFRLGVRSSDAPSDGPKRSIPRRGDDDQSR